MTVSAELTSPHQAAGDLIAVTAATFGAGAPRLLTDEPYDPAMWADDADDESLDGFRGGKIGAAR